MNLKQTLKKLQTRLAHYKGHWLATLGAVSICGTVFYLQSRVPPGMISYIASLPALGIILTTVLARLDDINLEQTSRSWQLRRLGFILVGSGTLQLALAPFGEHPKFPSWIGVMMAWGVALTWFTTPNMPPWWKFITGEYRTGRKNGQSIKPDGS